MPVARWLLHHGAVVQLSLRALWQTAQLREETVHHKLTSQKKVRRSDGWAHHLSAAAVNSTEFTLLLLPPVRSRMNDRFPM